MGGPYPPCHKTLWPRGYVTIEKHYICTFTSPMALKLGTIVTQVKWVPPTESSDHVVYWKIENFIFTLPENLWQPNLARWWLRVRNLALPLLPVILMHCKKFYCKQSILQVILLPYLLLHLGMQICTASVIYGTVFLTIFIKPLLRKIMFHSYIHLCMLQKRNTGWACDRI